MIQQTEYKGVKAVIIGNDEVSFTFLTERGGTMVSAKKHEKEFLIQRPGCSFGTVPFDGRYTEAECAGMDDMFPTIDPFCYEKFPWSGAKLSDHGEIWNLPCRTEIEAQKIRFTFHGVHLPYIFRKNVYMKADGVLRIDYSVENPTEFDMDFLWAAHIMLRADPGLTLSVPENCTKFQTVFQRNFYMGDYGDTYDYPIAVDDNGKVCDLSTMDESCGRIIKFYFKEKVREGFCMVRYPDKSFIEMRFPKECVPYLGILHSYNSAQGNRYLIVEPCTAPFDRPDIAKAMKKGSVISANSTYDWWLEIKV